MTCQPLLALRNATIHYPGAGQPVLRDLVFELHAGERVGLVGPIGSGKTTLLMSLVGLVGLARGELEFQGRVVRTKSDLAVLRRGVGVVFQNPDDQLFSPTVLEDVAFGLLNLGCSQTEALERSMHMLKSMHLDLLARREPHTLSGGQKRLVSLATVLVMRPKALLLDEPTNDLDGKSRELVKNALDQSGCALVVASHDQSLLAGLTNQSFVLPERN